MAKVLLENVNKVFEGNVAVKKKLWEFWKPSSIKGTVHVVKDANINIEDGEFMVLVGPSGCGKTTTLRMVAGLEEITSGKLYIGDRMVNDVSPKDRDIAMVFQNYALYPHMNVYENMAFGLKLRKFSVDEIEKRVNDAAALLGLEALLRRKPKELSGGQRQRVAMGRAIVRHPQVFLMDEPLSNLDAKLRVQMRAELQKLHRRLGVTTIYVTHDQMEAMTLGNRIVVMKDGLIQQIDSPLNLYEKPLNQFVAGFIGSPSMNFVTATVIKQDGQLFVKAKELILGIPEEHRNDMEPYVDKEVFFGIRPEDIYDHMFARGATQSNTSRALVEVSEPMGSEVFLHLNVKENIFTAKVDPHTNAVIGQEMELVFDMHKMYSFEVDSGKTITFPSITFTN